MKKKMGKCWANLKILEQINLQSQMFLCVGDQLVGGINHVGFSSFLS